VSAGIFGFQPKQDLEAAYQAYVQGVSAQPFWIPTTGSPDKSSSITSFLCTDTARDIFEAAGNALQAFAPAYGAHRPTPTALSNTEILDLAKRFRTYAAKVARRGTPHR
jgi:hypothetical protein